MPRVVLVTGSRDWDDQETIYRALDYQYKLSNHQGMIVVTGAARGADFIAEKWVAEQRRGMNTNVTGLRYPAKWSKYGKAAGVLRNEEMVRAHPDADVCLAFPLPGSVGTIDMMKRVEKAGIPFFDLGQL